MAILGKESYLFTKFSWSKLDTFARCPRKAFYRYVMRKREPVSEALLFGRGVHIGQEADNLERVKGRKRLPVGEVLDAAAEGYRGEGGSRVDAFVTEHQIQLERYEESGERAVLEPRKGSVEGAFEVRVGVTHDPDRAPEFEPAVIEGFVDCVSDEIEGGVVVDYKAVGRPVSKRDAEGSLQGELYRMGAEVPGLKFVSFVKAGKQKPTAKVTPVVRGIQRNRSFLLQFLADTIAAFRRCWGSGDWPKCTPSCHWCSPAACGYYEMCYPGRAPTKYIQVEEVKPVGTVPTPEWRKGAGKKQAEPQKKVRKKNGSRKVRK